MSKIIILFITFLKIGLFSFGGGYAMLPFIQQEFIDKLNFISKQEFLDLLAISQSTPGPIAINSATFVGYKVYKIIGSFSATVGVVFCSFVGLIIISKLLNKFKENDKIEKLLQILRPITIGFILSAVYSSLTDINFDIYFIIAFISSFLLIYTKKVGPIMIVFLYGIFGIVLKNFL